MDKELQELKQKVAYAVFAEQEDDRKEAVRFLTDLFLGNEKIKLPMNKSLKQCETKAETLKWARLFFTLDAQELENYHGIR